MSESSSASPEPGDGAAIFDYKRLRAVSPQAARQAVLDYLAWADGNIAATARAFGVSRKLVHSVIDRAATGSLADLPRTPHRQPTRTPAAIEAIVVDARNATGYGYLKLSRHLAESGLDLPWGTVRHILRRNQDRLRPVPRRRRRAAAKSTPLPPREPARLPGETELGALRRRVNAYFATGDPRHLPQVH